MKFGVREICDVVLKAKSNQWVGNKYFYKNEPVIYFDTLKTSSMEGAATTVYAQGGRGNSRLVAWEGERTVTFTMEDALISPEGFMILSGAGLIQGGTGNDAIKVHTTETTDKVTVNGNNVFITLKNEPYGLTTTATTYNDEQYVYIMPLDDHGEVHTEPYSIGVSKVGAGATDGTYQIKLDLSGQTTTDNAVNLFKTDGVVLVDYYVAKESGAIQIDITPDQFGGFYYLEASTLFRNQDGKDMPAEFVIPKCKIQSNFTFTMASSGDPSTFTFTIDAFPDYTRFNQTKKVFAAIQVISDDLTDQVENRHRTVHDSHINQEDLPDRLGNTLPVITVDLTSTSKADYSIVNDKGVYVVTKTNSEATDNPEIIFTSDKAFKVDTTAATLDNGKYTGTKAVANEDIIHLYTTDTTPVLIAAVSIDVR